MWKYRVRVTEGSKNVDDEGVRIVFRSRKQEMHARQRVNERERRIRAAAASTDL